MLVLSRKLNQQIRINDRVTLTILRIQGKSVRIGIEAPKDVHIVRGELPALDEDKQDVPGGDLDGPLQSKVIMARIPARDHESTTGRKRSDRDRRQSPVATQHPDRWTVSAMKDRTRVDAKTYPVDSRWPAR